MLTFDSFVYEHTNDGWKVSAWCEQEEIPIETEIKWYQFIYFVKDWYEMTNSEAMMHYNKMTIDEERLFLELIFTRRFNEKIPT